MIVFNTVIPHLQGNIGVAAYGVVANLSLVVISIYTGIAQGTQPIISRIYGSGGRESQKKILRYALKTMLVISCGIYLIFLFFASSIVSVFNSEQNIQLQQIAETGLKLYFTAIPFFRSVIAFGNIHIMENETVIRNAIGDLAKKYYPDDNEIVSIRISNMVGDAPRIVSTFAESYDFSGKTPIPFCISGGIGSSGFNLGQLTSGAEWLAGKKLGGSDSKDVIMEWVNGLGFDLNGL